MQLCGESLVLFTQNIFLKSFTCVTLDLFIYVCGVRLFLLYDDITNQSDVVPGVFFIGIK